MNPWNPRRAHAHWIESRLSKVRHFADWRDNVLRGHDDAALASRLTVSRARSAWFRPGEFDDLLARRGRAGLPSTDLASEDSEDALTWSVFALLANAPTSRWWTSFGLEEPPAIDLWPRHESSHTEIARAYRRCGASIEPHHHADQRSEIDVLLSTSVLNLLVEAKWKAVPTSASIEQISANPNLDREIRVHLATLATRVLAPGVSLDDVLKDGAYQTFRHLLYANELTTSTGRSSRLAYLVRGEAIDAKSETPDELSGVARELFGGLFQEPLPVIVTWRSLLRGLPDDVFDTPLSTDEIHAGATPRDYLAARRAAGQPAPLATPRPRASADPPLVLVNVCAHQVLGRKWVKRLRDWPVQTPRAKILAKYSVGTSALFGHYVFRYPHRESNRITAVDIEAADRLMGANISVRGERRENVLNAGASDALALSLSRIPPDATILEPHHDAAVCDAIEALTGRTGIGLAIATKLLCIKRPALVPMMDSLVQSCFDSTEPATILREFRRLLEFPSIAACISELADIVASLTGFTPTAVRILDELIWFDWNLEVGTRGTVHVVGFPEWGYDTDHDERGVHQLTK